MTAVPDDAFGDVPPEWVFVRTEFHPVDDAESYPDFAFVESFKHLELPEPDITVDVEGTDVVLETTDAALFVAVDASPLSGHFSDNYVHLTPGEPVRLSSQGAASESELEEAVSVRSLESTY
ncbi:glycoside hydrolase family 2 protein [Natrialba swarupiae]|uniref:Beta-mannosidase Ig-fold domain-containing protein n=1 Tax=Natrialba swarupiae TaxID=2448032 RepID=A0A5D5AR23_9EURY|nr:glycoside hydrolase family 2 protein [Natrialba swarupiae]TYT61501.1 hypothetical protein FYC77_13365 [Natrialba swarupiae]